MSNVAAGKNTDDEGEKLNDVEKVLTKLNIKLRDSKKEWRSFEDVIDEIASKWKDFSDTERSQIATAIAGTRQQETFRALMNNYDMVGNLAKTAADSTGSASERMETYLDSVEAKTNELKSTWEEFVTSLGQNDSYKTFLDMCIWILNNIPTIIGYGTSLLSIVVAFKAQKIADGILNIKDGLVELLSSTTGIFTNIGNMKKSWEELKTVKEADTAITAVNTATNLANSNAIEGQIAIEGMETATTVANTVATTANTKAQIANTAARKAASAVISGVISIIALTTAAIAKAITSYHQYREEIKKTAQDAYSAAKKQNDAEEEKLTTIQDSIKEYKKIQSEFSTYEEKQQALKTLSSKLTDAYGEEADSLNILYGSYDSVIKKMQELEAEQKKAEQKSYDAKISKANALMDNPDWIKGWSDIKYKAGHRITNKNSDFYKRVNEIVGDHGGGWNGAFSGNLNEMELNNTTSEGDAMKIVGRLESYFEEAKDTLSDYEKSALQGFIAKIRSAVSEETQQAYQDLEDDVIISFKEKNKEIYKTYDDLVEKIKTLKEKANKAGTKEEKSAYEKQIADMKNAYEDAYNQIKQKIDSAILDTDEKLNKEKKLKLQVELDNFDFDSYLDKDSGINWESLGITSNSAKSVFDKVSDEISTAGKISDETKKKIENLYDLLTKKGDATWLKNFIDLLEQLGVVVPDSWKKASAEKSIDKLQENKDSKQEELNKLQGNYNKAKEEKQKVEDDYGVGQAERNLENAKNGNLTADKTSYENNLKYYQNEYDRVKGLAEKEAPDTDAAKKELDDKKQEIIDEVENNLNDDIKENTATYNKLKEVFKNFKDSDSKTLDDFYKEVKNVVEGYDDSKNKGLSAKDTRTFTEKNLKDSGGQGTGTESEFQNYVDGINDVQDAIDKLNDGKYLDTDKLNKLKAISPELKEQIEKDGGATVQNLQKYLNKVKNNLDDDLDTMESAINKAFENIQDDIDNVSFDNFQDSVKDAAKMIKKEIGDDGALSDSLHFKIDNVSDVEDVTNTLKDAEAAGQGVEEEFGKVKDSFDEAGYSMSEADVSMSAMALSMYDAEYSADLLNNRLYSGEGSLNEAWQNLNISQLMSQETLDKYNLTNADEEGKKQALASMLKDWDNLTNGERLALASLLQYGAQYNGMSDDEKKYLNATVQSYNAGAAGLLNVLNNTGRYQINTRRNQNKTTPKKSSGSGSKNKKGSGSNYSAEDAASDLKDILNDIEKYEAEIELELEDQTEELLNQYNLKINQLDTLKEELDYYDSIYDVTENTTKWLDTQLKILDNQSKKVAEIQNSNDKIDKQRQKIYNENSKYNVKSWFDSEGNKTLAYGDLLNSFEYRKNQIEKETTDAMRAEYNKVANSTNKDTIKAAKDKIKQIKEEGDTKIKLIDKEKTYVENVYDSVSQLNDAWKENQEAIREALQELNDRVKSIRDELIDDIMEQLERAVDKMNTSIEKDVTRLEQLKQVQESYNNILNDTIDTQQELEDELKANMDSYQYLDETMRQLMFNEDDYKQLSGVIEGIQSDIANIWEDHYNQIQNLTEDEMYKAEYITNETERQLAAKQKEYDLAKAELDVAKAQTNLNNVKNERNTRIFANGEWQWVIYNYAHTFSNKR